MADAKRDFIEAFQGFDDWRKNGKTPSATAAYSSAEISALYKNFYNYVKSGTGKLRRDGDKFTFASETPAIDLSGLDQNVLDRVKSNYQSGWADAYNVLDQIDTARKAAGYMPVSYASKYTDSDIDLYLLSQGLPSYSQFSKYYYDAQGALATEAKQKEYTDAVLSAWKGVDAYSGALDEEKLKATQEAVAGKYTEDYTKGVTYDDLLKKYAAERQAYAAARSGWEHQRIARGQQKEYEQYQAQLAELEAKKQREAAAQAAFIAKSSEGHRNFGDNWTRYVELSQKDTLTGDEKREAKAALKAMQGKYSVVDQGDVFYTNMPAEIQNVYINLQNKSNWGAGFGAGFAEAFGIDWLMDKGFDLAAKGTRTEASKSIQEQFAEIKTANEGAYAAGNVTGDLTSLLMMGDAIGGGIAALQEAIPWLSKVAPALQKVIINSLTFGAQGAYQGMTNTVTRDEWNQLEQAKKDYYLEQGYMYEPIEYSAWDQVSNVLKQAGINTVGGAAGSIAGIVVGDLGKSILVKYGLQTPFAEALRQTLSGTAFAAGRITSTYWLYPEGSRPSKEQIAQDIAVSFLFSAITSAVNTAQVTKQNKAYLENAVEQMRRDYQATLNENMTPAQRAAALEKILEYNKTIRGAISQHYYAGQQSFINEVLQGLDAVDEQIRMIKSGLAGGTGAYSGDTSGMPAVMGAASPVQPNTAPNVGGLTGVPTEQVAPQNAAIPTAAPGISEAAQEAIAQAIAQGAPMEALVNTETPAAAPLTQQQTAQVAEVVAAAQNMGMNEAAVQAVTEAYAAAVRSDPQAAMKFQNTIQTATAQIAEVNADFNIAKMELKADLQTSYDAMTTAMQKGDEAAFNAAKAKYLQKVEIANAKNGAAKIKTENRLKGLRNGVVEAAQTLKIQQEQSIIKQSEAAQSGVQRSAQAIRTTAGGINVGRTENQGNRLSIGENSPDGREAASVAGRTGTERSVSTGQRSAASALGVRGTNQEAGGINGGRKTGNPADTTDIGKDSTHGRETASVGGSARLARPDATQPGREASTERIQRSDSGNEGREGELSHGREAGTALRAPGGQTDRGALDLPLRESDARVGADQQRRQTSQERVRGGSSRNEGREGELSHGREAGYPSDTAGVGSGSQRTAGALREETARTGSIEQGRQKGQEGVRRSDSRNEAQEVSRKQADRVLKRYIADKRTPDGKQATARLVDEAPPELTEALADITDIAGINALDVFLYESDDVFSEGFTDGQRIFVNLNSADPIHVAAHETAHNIPEINAAGQKVIEAFSNRGEDIVSEYAAYRSERISSPDEGHVDLSRELIADMYGAWWSTNKGGAVRPFGVNADIKNDFQRAFWQALVNRGAFYTEAVKDTTAITDNLKATGDPEYSRTAAVLFPAERWKGERVDATVINPTTIYTAQGIPTMQREADAFLKSGTRNETVTIAELNMPVILDYKQGMRKVIYQRHGDAQHQTLLLRILPQYKQILEASKYLGRAVSGKEKSENSEFTYLVNLIKYDGGYYAVKTTLKLSLNDTVDRMHGYAVDDVDVSKIDHHPLSTKQALLNSPTQNASGGAGGVDSISIFDLFKSVNMGPYAKNLQTPRWTDNKVEYSRVGGREVSREEAKTLPITDEDNLRRYHQEIDGVFDGSLPSGQMVILGKTPGILIENGFPDRTLYMEQSTARKIAYPLSYFNGKHNLGMSVLKQLPFQIDDPVAIMDNPQPNKGGYKSYIVVTEWKDQSGKPIIIPFHLNVQGAIEMETRVVSVFQADYFKGLLAKAGGTRYTRKNEDIMQLLSNGKSFPEASTDDIFITNILNSTGNSNKKNKDDHQILVSGKQLPEVDSNEILIGNGGTLHAHLNPNKSIFEAAEESNKNNEDIRQLLSNGKQLPEASADDVLITSVLDSTENSNENIEHSRISFDIGEGIEVSYPMPAIHQKKDGTYYVDTTIDGEKQRLTGSDRAELEKQVQTLKQEQRMKTLGREIKQLREVQRLYRERISVAEYYQQGGADHEVALALRGMYLANGFNQGGMINSVELDKLLENVKLWNEPSVIGEVGKQLALTFSFPARIWEDVANWRDTKTSEGRAGNYLEGNRLRDTYLGYLKDQGAAATLWENAETAKVLEAFDGKQSTSTLAQMLGEGIIAEKDAANAIYGKKNMVVKTENGVFLFDKRGQLVALSSGNELLMFDSKYRAQQRKAEIAAAKEASKRKRGQPNEEYYKGIREAYLSALNNAKPTSTQGNLIIQQRGNVTTVYAGMNALAVIEDGQKPNMEDVKKLKDALVDFYARVLPMQNGSLTENGYSPIPMRQEYFHHIGREAYGPQDFIDIIKGEAQKLPSSIAGLTASFSPGRQFVSHMLERMGDLTEYDAIRGFNRYLQGASSLIYMTPVIQRHRQLEKYLRENSGGSKNSALITWLHDYTNQLANKKPDLDRALEAAAGREIYTISDKLTGTVGGAAVAGNISVGLSNLISLFSSVPGLQAKQIPIAILNTFQNGIFKNEDGFTEKIPTLARRLEQNEKIIISKVDRVKRGLGNFLGWWFEVTDRIGTITVARAKYGELMEKGYTPEDAIRETDDFLVKMFADRNKGTVPLIFTARAARPWMQFMLEGWNQMFHFRDLSRQAIGEQIYAIEQRNGGTTEGIDWDAPEKKIKGMPPETIWRVLLYMVLMFGWNKFKRWLIGGGDQAFSPIDIAINIATADDAGAAISDTVEQLPFGSVWSGGRTPLASNVSDLWRFVTSLADSKKDVGSLMTEAAYIALGFFPWGGGQIKKTAWGVDTVFVKGDYYADDGRLRYPAEPDWHNYFKILLNGPSSILPKGYSYSKDTLTQSQTEKYQAAVAQGIDKMEAYYLLKDLDGNTNAGKLTSIVGLDRDKDGKSDLSPSEMNIMAAVIGVKIPEGKTVPQQARALANEYIEKKRADDGLSVEQRKAAEAYYDTMLRILGMKK